MEKYNLKNDIQVFGVKVKSFPNGVGEAFDRLVKMLPEGNHRSYYGISQMAKNGNMEYYATAEEVHAGEAEKYKCDRYTIEKGEYLVESIHDWKKKTDCIKDVFHSMIQDNPVDKKKPAVEWYKNEKEMLCMVKTVQPK
jgi:predicted transcriptional regulator YdeE